MVGYSDSNKDVGYVASGWAAYRAQVGDRRGAARHGVDAGCSSTAAAARSAAAAARPTARSSRCPPGTVGGRLKMTEQGEVLARQVRGRRDRPPRARADHQRRARPDAGRRRGASAERRERYEASLERDGRSVGRAPTASSSTATRTSCAFFAARHAGRRDLAPAARLAAGQAPRRRRDRRPARDPVGVLVDAGADRAARLVRAGHGAGSTRARSARRSSCCARWSATGRSSPRCSPTPRWRCAKADLGIARRYVELWDDEEPRERIWSVARGRVRRARARAGRGPRRGAAARPRAGAAGLDRPPQPVRRPAVLRADRAAAAAARGGRGTPEQLGRVSLLTINGIAGGLRNTG